MMVRPMKLKTILVPALSLFAAACMTVQTTMPGAIGVERKQSFLVSADEVNNASAQSYNQMVATGRQKGEINTDSAALRRVRAVADRLIPQVGVFRADAARWMWEVNVMTTDQINAFCMAGGKIMVYTGLIQKLNATDDELAAVMGHEIAHALREHSREKISNTYAQQLGLAVLGAVTGNRGAVQLAGAVSQVTFQLPNSREMETESDRIGLELMARAGYNPNAAVTFFRKLGQASGNNGPAFLSTHPQSDARAKDLEAYIPRVMPFYQMAMRS
jgi:predicted Zn-dependent protease